MCWFVSVFVSMCGWRSVWVFGCLAVGVFVCMCVFVCWCVCVCSVYCLRASVCLLRGVLCVGVLYVVC